MLKANGVSEENSGNRRKSEPVDQYAHKTDKNL